MELESEFFQRVNETSYSLSGIYDNIKKEENVVVNKFFKVSVKNAIEEKKAEVQKTIGEMYDVS